MALRHIESFNALNDDVRLPRFYESFTGGQWGNSDPGMHFGNSADGWDSVLRTLPLVSPNENTWIVGFGFRPDNAISVDNGGPEFPYVAIRNDDGEQIRLEFFTNNPSSTKPGGTYYSLRVMRGATELASTTVRFPIAAGSDLDYGWIYFQWKVTIDNASGSFELRYQRRAGHDGEVVATWDSATSGLDTQEQVSTGGNRVEIGWTSGSATRRVAFCDLYVCDGSGAVNNDFLGRTAVVVQKPADPAEGDTDQWTLTGGAADLNDAWDEPAAGGIDDWRNTSKNTGDISLARVDPVPYLRQVTIHGAVQRLTSKMETTGSLTLHHRWRKTTGTPAETDGTSFVVDSTAWKGDSDLRETDPNTASAFDVADLDAYQHGVRNGG